MGTSIPNKPFANADMDWTFACAAPVANTSDLALAAAPGATLRRYLTGIYVKNTNAVATEYVLKDGSTVIFRGHVNANMNQGEFVNFETPLRCSRNAALNFAAITTAAAIYVNAAGYTAP